MSALITKTRSPSKARRARKAGLKYVNDFDDGITRRRCGRGFVYRLPSGKTLKSKTHRQRIDSLVIPPAWEDVWICPHSDGHIQAKGIDEAGRPQYIYHDAWHAISTAAKFDRMELFSELLPRIRRRVRRDLREDGLTRERVAATVIRILDKGHIRVGNSRYAKENGSRGATTLTDDHVAVDGFVVSLDFPGKSGQQQKVEFRDRKVATVIEQCQELDGQFLFMYETQCGDTAVMQSSDINQYLEEICDAKVTAKDFRTWWGSVIASSELASLEHEMPEAERKRAIVAAVKVTADELGNTPAVCRSSYIHPGVLASASSGELPTLIEAVRKTAPDCVAELTQDEIMFATLLPRLSFS
ncbi:Eukaryotic DNA topoisomerase I, catalytic core [Rubripirellula amarantea]|uniref:DNA topoisomerase n=1 Tax=Rubripirellula amarantea TaxID=2527999 RepID=A0A5C5WV36_9BACT|nr:DNA topoisomerase IB [Rubripirellula amarantea]TWT54834.1 Eukaryotic DNA topoisomerase I, catalytic core [Rubripirellula amarantea]